MARGRKNWKLRIAFLAALLLAAGTAVHFGPRYIYSFFGDWALREVESKLGAGRAGQNQNRPGGP